MVCFLSKISLMTKLYYYNDNWEFFEKNNKHYFFDVVTTKLLELVIKRKEEKAALLFFIKKASKPSEKEKLISDLHLNFPKIGLDWINTTFNNLFKVGVVKMALLTPLEFQGRYVLGLERQLEFLNEVFPVQGKFKMQRKLKDAKITVIGLGIVGQSVLVPLLASGIGNLTCIDFDTVEERNIGRQILFRRGDNGKPKTEVIKRFVVENYSAVRIKIINKKLDNVKSIKAAIKGSDIVIQCCDFPRYIIHRLINEACLDLKIPNLLLGSYRAGPFCLPHKTACYGCLETLLRENMPIYDEIVERIFSQGTRRFPQLIITSLLTGALGAKEIITFLLGLPTQTIDGCLHFNPRTLEVTREPIPKQTNCYACSPNAK